MAVRCWSANSIAIDEFGSVYAITGNGRIELSNINGDVRISSWDRNEVKVDAVKYADSKERLDEAKIEIDAGKEIGRAHV